jgi:hypothetical protein
LRWCWPLMSWCVSVAVSGDISISAICLKWLTNRLTGLLLPSTKGRIYFSDTELVLPGRCNSVHFFNRLRILFVKVCTCSKFTLGTSTGWCLLNDCAIGLSVLRTLWRRDCFWRIPIYIFLGRLYRSSLRLFGDRWLRLLRLGKVTPRCFLTFRLYFLPLHPVCVYRAFGLLLTFG